MQGLRKCHWLWLGLPDDNHHRSRRQETDKNDQGDEQIEGYKSGEKQHQEETQEQRLDEC